SAQREFTQHFPQPGWVEHDPLEIWSSQRETAMDVLRQAGCTAAAIAAIGITNQRETTLVWERSTGVAVYNAIVWQDRRTAPLCESLRAQGLEAQFSECTGLLLDPYFSGTKIRWILDCIPRGQQRAEAGELCFGTVDSWLIWKLTGGRAHLTDSSNASRTLLFNLRSGNWDDELLQHLNIPRRMLPEVVPSSGVVAHCEDALFGGAIPIAGIAGDQQAALFGQRCVKPGMVKNTYGTGCFMLMHTGEQPARSAQRLLTTSAWTIGGRQEFALEGSVFVAGAAVQWLRDGLGLIRSSSEVEALAASVPDNGGVYVVPAFTGLGAPYWDPYASGLMIGLTRGSTAAHIARATLEAIAYQSADLAAAMRKDAAVEVKELRVDGGAAKNDLLMQFQADILGIPVVRPAQWESTALGAAYLAGLAVKFWSGADEIDAQWRTDHVFEPAMSGDQRANLLAHWKRAVDRSKAWMAP
ncbi:MAG: glycerol kinase GlpK, partial [Burkholderiales bacterium]